MPIPHPWYSVSGKSRYYVTCLCGLEVEVCIGINMRCPSCCRWILVESWSAVNPAKYVIGEEPKTITDKEGLK